MTFVFDYCEFFCGLVHENSCINSHCLFVDCRGWRPEGAANIGHLNQSFDNVTWKAAYVPFTAVLDRRPKPPVVCSPPPLPAPKPQRALHGWKPPCLFATWWVTTVTGLGVGQSRDRKTNFPSPKEEKNAASYFLWSLRPLFMELSQWSYCWKIW